MEHTAIRQHPRFPLRLPVLCESPAVSSYSTFGLTQDVSEGGLLLEVPQPLSPGTPTSLLLITGGQNARAEGVVSWMAEGAPGRMGLRFTSWAGTDFFIWERLLSFQAGPTPRTALRIPVAVEVTCRSPSGTRLQGRAANLSDGGMMVVLDQVLLPRTRLTMAVPPWLTLPAVETEMEVLWSRDAPAGRGVLHGMRFLWDDIARELFLIGTLLRHLVTDDAAAGEGSE